MDKLWQLIPQITSPLAAISFVVYLIYLIRRAIEKRKSATLTVGDDASKAQAAKVILRDIPDVELPPIEKPKDALELAKEIIAGKMARYHKTMNSALLVVAICAITFLLAKLIGDEKNPVKITTSKSWAENMAVKKELPYPILSIVCHITLSNVKVDSNTIRRASFRYHYVLKATRNIEDSEKIFQEQFVSNEGNITPWAGSELQEIESIKDGRYWVKFNAKQGDIFTVTTGANYTYKPPFSNTGTSCFDGLELSSDEWLTCYPNSIDYIDNLTFIVEGIDAEIGRANGNSMLRKGEKGVVTSQDGATCRVYQSDKACKIIAKWQKIAPGECVGLKIKWPPTT
ncbi:hypothetical protein MUK70_19115 [Dyadobacter chenwenxiniae]|uniref:Uncharacterized protein n=1 Tax=Dyadobacter chenwenxiniae TaxID=2906456 RepID=A0A9X1PHI8_9BACT|nr:hypothetical protein [Dyadobacter chenwenxiniae]MCF0061352.1 hypothetical protein [Dyadobacter chenwenxiniae]UON81174.1 hypothetical protein MUK70_19115 [Dyadobacter chenwenxiniae]